MEGFVFDGVIHWYDYEMRFHLDLIQSYISETENLIIKGIEKYEDEKETEIETGESDGYEFYYETQYYEGVDSSTYNLDEIFKEYFPNLKRQSVFIMICSAMEKNLSDYCRRIQYKNNDEFSVDDLIGRGRGKLNAIKTYLDRTILINNRNRRLDICWVEFTMLYKIRNQIAHNFGELKKNEKVKKHISNRNLIRLNELNEVILEKGFLDSVVELLRALTKEIQASAQKKYDNTYKLN